MTRDLLAEYGTVEMPAEVRTYVELLERQVREDGLDQVGAWALDVSQVFVIDMTRESTRKLVEYWVHGKGAQEKIHWGVKGSMHRCIRHLTGKVREPGGLCAEYHRLATGEWPTEHGKAGIPS